MSGKAPQKAAFLDREGGLNLDHGYVCEPERLDTIDERDRHLDCKPSPA